MKNLTHGIIVAVACLLLLLGTTSAGSINKDDEKLLSKSKIADYTYEIKDKNGQSLSIDKVTNKIDKAKNLLLDCELLTCDYKVEITAKQAMTFDMDTLAGAYLGTGASIKKVFFMDTRQVQETVPTFTITQEDKCVGSGANQTCYKTDKRTQTGAQTITRTESFENTALTTPFAKDEKRTYVIRFAKTDTDQNIDIYHSIFGQERKDGAWWNNTFNKRIIFNAAYSDNYYTGIANATINLSITSVLNLSNWTNGLDIRFTSTNMTTGTETEVCFHRWNWTSGNASQIFANWNTTTATGSINVQMYLNNGSNNLTMYLNSSTANADKSNENCTYLAADEFGNGTTIDATKWTQLPQSGKAWAITNGAINISHSSNGQVSSLLYKNALNVSDVEVYMETMAGDESLDTYWGAGTRMDSFTTFNNGYFNSLVSNGGNDNDALLGWKITSGSIAGSDFTTNPTNADNCIFTPQSAKGNWYGVFYVLANGTQSYGKSIDASSGSGCNYTGTDTSYATGTVALIHQHNGWTAWNWVVTRKALNGSLTITTGAIENASVTMFVKTAITSYNGTHINYTFTAIAINNGSSALTGINVSLWANGSQLTSVSTTIGAGGTYTLSSNWSVLRPAADANFTASANATGGIISPASDTALIMLPIDPPNAMATKHPIYAPKGNAFSWSWGQLMPDDTTMVWSDAMTFTWLKVNRGDGKLVMNGTPQSWTKVPE